MSLIPIFYGGGQVATIAAFDSAFATGNSITAPDGILAGDIIVLWDVILSDGPGGGVPSGFTGIESSGIGNARLSYKIAAGTEGGTSITGITGTSPTPYKAMAVFRPSVAPSVSVQDSDLEFTADNPAAQTISANGADTPLIALAAYAAGGGLSGASLSPSADDSVDDAGGESIHIRLSWKIYNTAPADLTADLGDSGTANVLASCYLQVSAA
jgi:hypothetical protein